MLGFWQCGAFCQNSSSLLVVASSCARLRPCASSPCTFTGAENLQTLCSICIVAQSHERGVAPFASLLCCPYGHKHGTQSTNCPLAHVHWLHNSPSPAFAATSEAPTTVTSTQPLYVGLSAPALTRFAARPACRKATVTNMPPCRRRYRTAALSLLRQKHSAVRSQNPANDQTAMSWAFSPRDGGGSSHLAARYSARSHTAKSCPLLAIVQFSDGACSPISRFGPSLTSSRALPSVSAIFAMYLRSQTQSVPRYTRYQM